MRRILLLDDEAAVLHALQRTLRNSHNSHNNLCAEELKIEAFTDPEKALLRSAEVAFDVAISDYRMPGMSGIEFLKMIKGIQPHAVRLLLSATTEFRALVHAINQAEVFRYIPKPWQEDELADTLSLAFAHYDQAVEDRRLADELRVQRGELSLQELEAKRLEAEEPGITKVKWGDDGAVQLD